MKISKVFVGILAMVFCLATSFSSCKKEAITATEKQKVDEEVSIGDSTSKGMMTTYYSSPTVGNYTSNSSSSVTIGGTCGTHSGGVLRAKLQSKSGNQFTVRISKQDGSNFGIAGTAYVKAASLCGGIAGQISYSAGVSYVDVTFYATFSQGIVNFYPMTIDGTYGYRYYAEPILVYTDPMFLVKSTYTQNENLGTVNGVIVKASSYNLDNPNDLDVQCTEFCCRYYQQVYGQNIVNTGQNGGNACDWFSSASAKNLIAYSNGGSMPPKPGDILCMSGGSGLGHVAIIIQVASNFVKIAQQNGHMYNTLTDWNAPIGGQLNYNSATNTISMPTPNSSYTIQGWLRIPPYWLYHTLFQKKVPHFMGNLFILFLNIKYRETRQKYCI